MTNPTKTHSRLGASNCKRWWACPGSVAACANLQNQSTSFANEGSAAHALGELCLRNRHMPDRYLDMWINMDGTLYEKATFKPADLGATVFPVDEDMVEAVQVYVDFFLENVGPDDEYEIEQRVDLSNFHPDLFGTADLVIYKPGSQKLVVADYKHGRGVPVEVTENVQGLYYAAGAAVRGHNRGVKEVEVVIIQPRCAHRDGPVRRWSTTPLELLEWVSDLVAAAHATEAKDAPRNAGDWCKFCPAAPTCPAFAGAAIDAARADFADDGSVVLTPPTGYSPPELAKTLSNIDLIESWCRAVKKFAHDEAIAGRTPPGFKLVNTRATRRWKDEQATLNRFQVLELDEAEYLTEPELRSVAQVEKAVGKKAFSKFTDMVESKSSGVTLAPLDDKREAVRPDAASEFA